MSSLKYLYNYWQHILDWGLFKLCLEESLRFCGIPWKNPTPPLNEPIFYNLSFDQRFQNFAFLKFYSWQVLLPEKVWNFSRRWNMSHLSNQDSQLSSEWFAGNITKAGKGKKSNGWEWDENIRSQLNISGILPFSFSCSIFISNYIYQRQKNLLCLLVKCKISST